MVHGVAHGHVVLLYHERIEHLEAVRAGWLQEEPSTKRHVLRDANNNRKRKWFVESTMNDWMHSREITPTCGCVVSMFDPSRMRAFVKMLTFAATG